MYLSYFETDMSWHVFISILQVFLVIVWNFELYMVPITLLIVFFKNLLVVHIAGNLMKDKDEDVSSGEQSEICALTHLPTVLYW